MNMFIETINHTSFWRRSNEDPKTKSSIRQQGGQADFFFERGQAEFSSGKRRPPARAVTTAPAERAIIYPKRK
jgi:hypothetical protein